MSGSMSSSAPASPAGLATTEGRSSRFGWRRLQVGAAIVTVVSFAVPMILDGKVEPFLLGMAAPFVVGLVLALWLPRVAAVFLGVVSLAILLASAPFIGGTLMHPEALPDFLSITLLVVATIVGAVAAIPAYRELKASRPISGAPRMTGIIAAVVVVVAAAVSTAAAARVQDVAAQPGDVRVRTEDFVFAPDTFTAKAGTVSVHLTNTDSTRHTFTIDGITDVSIPPNGTQRVTFEATAGTYRFYCVPHAPAMDGQLNVQ